MIKRELPSNIYRCKGFVHLADDPANRYLLQVVGRRVDITVDRGWADEPPRNRVVAIAHRARLDQTNLSSLFDSCASTDRVDVG
jgi:G3E family GTPase